MADDTENEDSGSQDSTSSSTVSGPSAPHAIYSAFYNHAIGQGADDAGAREFANLGLGVADREGLHAKNLWGNSGDHGKSWGPFQLLMGGGIGDQLNGDTSPLNQLKVAASNMWGENGTGGYYNTRPWNGAGDFLAGFGTGNGDLNDSEQAQNAMIARGSALAKQFGINDQTDLSNVNAFLGPDANKAVPGLTTGGLDPRAFMAQAGGGNGTGALSATGMTGDLGALYRMVQQDQQNNQPSWGQRLAAAGAALASISSPSQGSTLASIANQGSNNKTSNTDALLKALQLRKAMQGDTSSFQKMTPDGKAAIMQAPDGHLYTSDVPGLAQHQEAEDTSVPDKTIPQIDKQRDLATNNAGLVNEGLDLQKEINSNPNVFKNLSYLAQTGQYVDNTMGKSSEASALTKRLNSYINRAVLATNQASGISRPTNVALEMEKQAVDPNGARYDAVTTSGILGNFIGQAQRRYDNSSASMNTYYKKYKDNYSWGLTDNEGKPLNPNEYQDYNHNNWNTARAANQKAYDTILKPWHDQYTGVTPPKSIYDTLHSSIFGSGQ